MERRILTKHQQALQKAERVNILQYPGVCQLFVLACIVTDAFTLYTIFDIMLKTKTFVDFGNYCHGGNSFKYDS